jgi:Tfp pilus assembly protein PilE
MKGIKMKKNESGRSMVEMLGVLAIIGVLSVGGIAGYTMAMKKYKANEAAQAIALAAVECYATGTKANGNGYVTIKECSGKEGKVTYELAAGMDEATVEAILTTQGVLNKTDKTYAVAS